MIFSLKGIVFMKNSLITLKKIWCCLAIGISVHCLALANQEIDNDLNNFEQTELVLTCPVSEIWINCMPIIGQSRSEYCRPDVRNWMTQNCPNVHYAD